jgi:uncharacterized protein YodC (DUF2158 family)
MGGTAFRPGDMVRLKNGGPDMVIYHISNGWFRCLWDKGDGTLGRKLIDGDDLDLIKRPDGLDELDDGEDGQSMEAVPDRW